MLSTRTHEIVLQPEAQEHTNLEKKAEDLLITEIFTHKKIM